MEIQHNYTIARYGGEFFARKYAAIAQQDFDSFCKDFYLRAMNLRKWNNNGEHAKSKGLKLNTWHRTDEDGTHICFELYNEKGDTFYKRVEKCKL